MFPTCVLTFCVRRRHLFPRSRTAPEIESAGRRGQADPPCGRWISGLTLGSDGGAMAKSRRADETTVTPRAGCLCDLYVARAGLLFVACVVASWCRRDSVNQERRNHD